MASPSRGFAALKEKPFAVLVISGALIVVGLSFFLLMAVYRFFDSTVAIFGAVFIAVGILAFWGKRWWALVPAAGLSVFFLIVYTPFVADIFVNPAAQGFWLAVTLVPLLILTLVFSILSLAKWRKGLAATPYLASAKSSGGFLTVAVIGFIIGGLVIGGFAAGTINRLLNGGGQSFDVKIVTNAATVMPAYSPASFHAKVGVPVTWFNQDTIAHTVTSVNGSELNSGNIASGAFFTHTFTQAGTYDYYCTIHPGMRGTVVVTPF